MDPSKGQKARAALWPSSLLMQAFGRPSALACRKPGTSLLPFQGSRAVFDLCFQSRLDGLPHPWDGGEKERFLDGVPILFRDQDGIVLFAGDLDGDMALGNAFHQLVQIFPSFRSRDRSHLASIVRINVRSTPAKVNR